MDPAFLAPMYRFNTWANGQLRQAARSAGDELVRRPLELWFGSASAILTHVCAGESIWLARLRDGSNPDRLLTAADFPSVAALCDAWAELNAAWESYVAGLDAAALEQPVRWTSQLGDRFTHLRWQILMHIPFHSSEHRAHAATALTQLGVPHGPQDFHLQFMPAEAVSRRQRPPE